MNAILTTLLYALLIGLACLGTWTIASIVFAAIIAKRVKFYPRESRHV